MSHSYQTYFSFAGSDLNLDCGLRDHVITRFASVGIEARLQNKVISFCYFCIFSVPLSFPVFAFIFLFFVSASSKQNKKRLYSILLLHIMSIGGKIALYFQFKLILISFA
jgi:hypothetical protein